jgi:hypothetical protein
MSGRKKVCIHKWMEIKLQYKFYTINRVANINQTENYNGIHRNNYFYQITKLNLKYFLVPLIFDLSKHHNVQNVGLTQEQKGK